MRRGWKNASRLVAGVLVLVSGSGAAALAVPEPYRIPTPVVRTLKNGLVVAVFQQTRQPIVQIQVMLPAGAVHEQTGELGVAALTAQLMRRGTQSRSAGELASLMEGLGGRLTANVGREVTTVSGAFLARDFEAGIELLADVVRNPSFPADDLEELRRQLRAAMLQSYSDAASVAEEHLWGIAWEGHPYARPLSGTGETLARLGQEQVRSFHRTHYRPQGALLAIAGDVTPERAMATVEEQFGAWEGAAPALALPQSPQSRAGLRIRLVDRPGPGPAEIRLGEPAPARRSADHPTMLVAHRLFRDAVQSRSRSETGLVTALNWQREGGLFMVGVSSPVDSVVPTVKRLRSELDRFSSRPAAESDLARARRNLKNAFPLQFETGGALIAHWMSAKFFGMPEDYLERYAERIAAVTPEQIQEVATRWRDSDRLSLVVVGPAQKLEARLRTLSEVEVVRLGASPVPVALVPSTIVGPASPEQQAQGRKIVDQAATAHGGLGRLREIQDSTVEGEMTLFSEGREMKVQIRQVRKEPNRLLFASTMMGFHTLQVLDGDDFWSRTGDELDTLDVRDTVQVAVLRESFRSDLPHLMLAAVDGSARVAFRGQEKLGERQADVVEMVNAKGERRILFFDAETHLLVGMEENQGATGRSLRRLFRDHRKVKDVTWPHTEERQMDGIRVILVTLRRIDFNNGIEDAAFKRPTR